MKIDIYTDGACTGNPGKGGYGIVMRLIEKNYEKRFSEGFRNTTNNRMELMAVVESFKKLKSPQSNIEFFTDSRYVSEAINKGWLEKWQARSFKNVKNPDLWQEFLRVSARHKFRITWVKGHSGNVYNEVADKLAVQAYEKSNLKIDTFYEKSIET